MEILVLANNCLKIKGKRSSIVVDPQAKMPKTTGDGVILTSESQEVDPSRVDENRVLIKGPGEYEFSEVKISVSRGGEDLVYEMKIDGIDVLFGKAEGVDKLKDKLKECKIAILYVNSKFDDSLLTAIKPNVVIFYGDQAQEAVKTLGKDENNPIKPVSKYSVKPETLPEEMETVLLASS